jgi:cell division septation protein DedD
MSMPSFDYFKSAPTTEVLRIESEPPGADARTSQGQTCRTPCELTVPTEGELAVTVQMTGYQAQTLPVRPDGRGGDTRLQPNPVYVELQPAAPVKPARPAPVAKRKTSAASPPAPRPQTQAAAPASNGGYSASGQGYPWPPAPQ